MEEVYIVYSHNHGGTWKHAEVFMFNIIKTFLYFEEETKKYELISMMDFPANSSCQLVKLNFNPEKEPNVWKEFCDFLFREFAEHRDINNFGYEKIYLKNES